MIYFFDTKISKLSTKISYGQFLSIYWDLEDRALKINYFTNKAAITFGNNVIKGCVWFRI